MRLLVIALSLLLAGCATAGDLGALSRIAQDDLKAALADAQAHGDQAAISCYTVLAKYLTAPPTTAPVKGVVSAFQQARDLVGGGGDQVAKDINLGCAALMVDANATLVKLGAIAAPK